MSDDKNYRGRILAGVCAAGALVAAAWYFVGEQQCADALETYQSDIELARLTDALSGADLSTMTTRSRDEAIEACGERTVLEKELEWAQERLTDVLMRR